MSNASDSITRKVEEAATAYLTAYSFSSGIPSGFTYTPGFNDNARTFPCCAVIAGKPVETIPTASVYRIPVTLQVMTKRGDTSEAAHGLIAGLIERAFWDNNAVKTALNKPNSPTTDTRTVQSFYLYELFCNGPGPEIQNSENVMISSIEMEWVCQGWNHIA
jgi:hypothetical protein